MTMRHYLSALLLFLCLLGGSANAQFGGFGAVPAGVNSPNAVPIQGTPNGVPLPIAGTISGSSNFGAALPTAGVAVGAEYLASPPTFANGQMVPLQTDANGKLVIIIPDGAAITLGNTTDGVWGGSGSSTVTQTERAIYNAVIAPITPCSTSNCGAANPIGSVLIASTLPAFASTPTFNLGTLNGAATAANQPTNNAQGAAIAGVTGDMIQAETLSGDPLYTTATVNPVNADLFGHIRVANGHILTSVTPTVTNNGAYVAGNVIGTGAVNTANTLSYTVTAATIDSITVTSQSQVQAAITIYIFWQNPAGTTWTDKTTPTIAQNDRVRQLAGILVNPMSGMGAGTVWYSGPLNLDVQASTFFVILIANGPFTLTSATTSDFNIRANLRL